MRLSSVLPSISKRRMRHKKQDPVHLDRLGGCKAAAVKPQRPTPSVRCVLMLRPLAILMTAIALVGSAYLASPIPWVAHPPNRHEPQSRLR